MNTPNPQEPNCSASRWRRRGPRRLFSAAMLLLTLLIGATWRATVSAAESEATAAPSPIQFHRVFAPADRLEDWPRGEGTLPSDGDAGVR